MNDSGRYEALVGDFYETLDKMTVDGTLRRVSLDCSIGRDQGRYIYETVLDLKPASCLEIGMAWGGSSLHICAGLEANGVGGRLLSVDPFQMNVYSGVAMHEMQRLGFGEYVELSSRRSDIVMPSLLSEGKVFDFIFIDGDHRFDGAFVDVYYAQQLLREGGEMILDDAQSVPLQKVLSFVESNYKNLSLKAFAEGRFAHLVKTGSDNRADGDSFDF